VLRDQKLAATILRALFGTGASLDRSIAIVKVKGSTAEFNAYRAAVGQVMGELWTHVMAPLLQAHPSLAPKTLSMKVARGSGKPKPSPSSNGAERTRRNAIVAAPRRRRLKTPRKAR